VSLATFFLAGRRTRLDRQRQVFADALDTVMRYREYPFIVYRRNADEPAKERQRISAELSELQAKLNGFKGRLRVEDPFVGAECVKLIDATRRIAGPMIAEAWNREPASLDTAVHNPGWEFSELTTYDEAYLRAVADHLGWLYAPLRRRLRGMRRGSKPMSTLAPASEPARQAPSAGRD
jgi:hypothetical protein